MTVPAHREKNHCWSLARTVVAVYAMVLAASADDWPTFGHDHQRSHVSADVLKLPLQPAWVWKSPTRPRTAWAGPAKWDAYAKLKGFRSMRDFDPVFYVTTVGNRAYFGSSVDDSIRCLDADTSETKWTFTTDGPVRLPPTLDAGMAYFGSDDGNVYCVSATDGAQVWRTSAAPTREMLLADGRMVSKWPVRTGVVVDQAVAYFGASLVPWENSFLCAVGAEDGKLGGTGTYRVTHPGMTIQGPMLMSLERLFLPQGRQRPVICSRATGQKLSDVGGSGQGGVYALLIDDGLLVHGRGQNHGQGGELRGIDTKTRETLATFPRATCLAAKSGRAYVAEASALKAFDRHTYMNLMRQQTRLRKREAKARDTLKKGKDKLEAGPEAALRREIEESQAGLRALKPDIAACYLWEQPSACTLALILAGEWVISGGEGRVEARKATDGTLVWDAQVAGRAYGLTAGGGRLFVSTDLGRVYAFSTK